MVYKPAKLPAVEEPGSQALAGYLEDELQSLSHEMTNNVKEQKINPSHKPPDKPRVGTIVYADGVDWNPGSGEGLYVYDSGGNWIFLEIGATPLKGPFPVFSVGLSSDQTGIANSTFTKVLWDTVNFDSDSWWDASAHQYKPQRAGYYIFTANVNNYLSTGTISRNLIILFKNGVDYARLFDSAQAGESAGGDSVVVHMNGSSDFVDVRVFITSTTARGIEATPGTPHFSGAMVRDD